MARIGVMIADGFEDVEYSEPAQSFREAGHELVHLGIEHGKTVRGAHDKKRAKIDRSLRDAAVGDYDALFIPGGFSPDRLRAHDEAVDFVRKFAATGKPMLLICHGPQLLINADVARGRTLTGWKSIRKDLENAGAKVEDREVVRDGNLVTSREPKDIPAFVKTSLEVIEEHKQAETHAAGR